MRIAIAHTDFRLYWPARLNALSQFLDAKGHILHVVEIAGKGSPYAFAGYTKERALLDWTCLFPEKTMESIPGREASSALFTKLEELRPDVVLAGAIAFPSGAAAVRWCKARNRGVIIFDNARLQDVPRSWPVNFIKRHIYRNVDAVLAPAPSHAAAFECWGVTPPRIFYGLNVIDNEWFASKVGKLRNGVGTIMADLDLPKKYILGVGRLIAKKNWVGLVNAFVLARKEGLGSGWSLVLVGDGPVKADLEELCRRPGYENVHLHPFASQEDLCQYYATASGLVLPSRFGETWGLVVNEAMACGLPVLVSKECGCAETLVDNGGNGYLFSPDVKESMVEALSRFMCLSDMQRNAMGERSREIISMWSLDSFVQGAWAAIQYAQSHPLPAPTLLDALIIHFWRGRYRPV